jgi:DNA-binding CsgD family transcriptional regulator
MTWRACGRDARAWQSNRDRDMEQTSRLFDLSLNLFTAVFEKVPDIAVNLLNKDFRVLWANEIMAVKVGRSLDELIGRPCYSAFRWRETPCEPCLLKIVSETKKPLRMERWLDLPGQERRYAEVRAYPVFDGQGLVKHVFELLIPLDQKKKDEEQRLRYVESLEGALRRVNAAGLAGSEESKTDEVPARLTPREKEVLRLMAQGFSNKEIASILNISFDTAKTHVRNIFSKLNVTDRTQAAVWAVSNKEK